LIQNILCPLIVDLPTQEQMGEARKAAEADEEENCGGEMMFV